MDMNLTDEQVETIFERAIEAKAEEILDEQGDYTLKKALETHIGDAGPRHHAHLVDVWGRPCQFDFDMTDVDDLSDEQEETLKEAAIDAKVEEIKQEVHGEGSRHSLKKAIESHLDETSLGYKIHLIGPERVAKLIDVPVEKLPEK